MEDVARYLGRMGASVPDKERVLPYVRKGAQNILDVGCADGAFTLRVAEEFPHACVLGIDIDPHFVERARHNATLRGVHNVRFEHVHLHELLTRDVRYDAVLFMSVWHEFKSRGYSASLYKALGHAHELLRESGRIIGRDPMCHEHACKIEDVAPYIDAIQGNAEVLPWFERFLARYGPAVNLRVLNHFLLKYLYTNNWTYEMEEDYLAMPLEWYVGQFRALEMRLVYAQVYLLPFLREKWQTDFGLHDADLDRLSSNGVVVVEKSRRKVSC